MQFGFIKKSSTTSAAIHLIELIVKNLEKTYCTSGLFIDLSKAFDCLKHDHLEKILSSIGIKNCALSLIMDYFKDRTQFVYINSSVSTNLPILNGIQQGSTLGPLIFLLYVNHVFTLPLNGKLILYADDCALIYGSSTYEDLSEQMSHDISMLTSFFNSINLQINLKKSKYIIFKPNSNLVFDSITVNNHKIERVDCYKYLGLFIDSQLKWTHHAKHISKILSKYCALFYRIRNYLKIRTLITIYFAHVHSHLTYMLPVWGGAADFIIDEIQKLQNKILKLIYRKPRLANVDNFYKFTVDESILRFSLLVDYEAAYFIYKVKNGFIKCHSSIQTNYEVSGRVTRGSNQLRRGDFISTAGQKSIFYRGVHEYNKIPETIRSEVNINTFKKSLKKFIRK
jgi:ribonuclease P/MRP protein subunit RPP40